MPASTERKAHLVLLAGAAQLQAQCLGRRRTEDDSCILAELLRAGERLPASVACGVEATHARAHVVPDGVRPADRRMGSSGLWTALIAGASGIARPS